ncbi:MAG: hypothetical protein J0L64_26535 [Acidobacteria bacterium]|nr:hypothetical protein [Acidobacteriota bacterium]
MPITLPPLPNEVLTGFLHDLADFLPHADDLRQFILTHTDTILGIPLYRILPDRLRAGERTAAAEPVAWRLLAASPSQGIAADLARLPSLQRFAIASASVSPNVPGLINLVQEVLHRTCPPGTDFELRLLRMKAAYLELAWLKSNNSAPDLFIPLSSGLPDLNRRETYNADQVFSQARIAAQRTTGFRMP